MPFFSSITKGLLFFSGSFLLYYFVALASCGGESSSNAAQWKVYAIKYGETAKFNRSTLVSDARKGETSPISWCAWLLRSTDRQILIDTGFADRMLAKKWRIEGYRTVPEALKTIGLSAEDITDVVITHMHWDHVGNVGPYKQATFWMQKREFEWAKTIVSRERPSRWGIRLKDLEALAQVEREGRLKLVGRNAQIARGVFFRDGGAHTKAIQWVEVHTNGSSGTVVLASDNAYLWENISRPVSTNSTADPNLDLEALGRIRSVVSREELAIPGHDPETFKRFPIVASGIVEIR